MILVSPEKLDIFRLEDAVWIAEAKIGVPLYDFGFENFFACRRPLYRENEITAVGRFGVSDNYPKLYETLLGDGVRLIHTPAEYRLASELTEWYPLIEALTPRSRWYDEPPDYRTIENDFDYPVFLKGSRQTSRHRAEFSIVRSREEYRRAAAYYKTDRILHWQKIVVREFVKLRRVEGVETEKIPPSFVFRTFWWKGNPVGEGLYWKDFARYDWTAGERTAAVDLARKAVEKLSLPFVAVDVAQKTYRRMDRHRMQRRPGKRIRRLFADQNVAKHRRDRKGYRFGKTSPEPGEFFTLNVRSITFGEKIHTKGGRSYI